MMSVHKTFMIILTTFLISNFIPKIYASTFVVGQIYPIQEEDLLEFILHRIQVMQQDGSWQNLQNQFRDHVAKHADRPQRVASVTKAIKSESWNYDPSVTLPYDLQDSTGTIFARKGTTINPLEYITIHKTLIFYDGDDKTQVNWAENLNQKLSGKTKLILVNGSISDQVKRFHQPIYFDQAGRLTAKFHIQYVPAVVVQEGLHLKISEVAI